jgi:hypothetical protein
MKRAKKVRNFLAATKFTRIAADKPIEGGVSIILKKNMKFKLNTANEDKFFKTYILIDDEEKKFCFRIGGVEWAAISISLLSDSNNPVIALLFQNKKGEFSSLLYNMVARGDVDNTDFDDIINAKKNIKINSSAFPNSEEVYEADEKKYMSATCIYISQAQMGVIRKQYSDIHIDTRSVNVMDAIELPDQKEIEPEPIGFDDNRMMTRFDVWINRCQVYCINREYPEHNYTFQGNYRDIPGIVFYQEGNRIIMQVCFTYYIGDSNVESLYYLLEPVADDRPEFDSLFNGKSVSIEKLLVRTPKKYIQLDDYNYISCERLAVSQKQLDRLFDLINSDTPIETRLKDKTSTVSAKRENVSSMTGAEKIFVRRNDIVPSLKVEFSDSSIAVVHDGGKGDFVVENPDDKLPFCKVYRSGEMTEYYLKAIKIKIEPPRIRFTVAGTLDDMDMFIEMVFRESSDDYTMPTALHLIKNTTSFDVTPSDFSFKDSVYYDDEGFIVTLEGPYVSLDVLSEFDPIGTNDIIDIFMFYDEDQDFYADENYRDSGKLVFISIDPDTPAPAENTVRVFSIIPYRDHIAIGTRDHEGIEITIQATLQVIRDDAEISDTFISELLNNNNIKHINLASLLMDDAIYVKKGFSYITTGGPYITEHDLVAWVEKYGKKNSDDADKEENTVSAWSMIAGWFTVSDEKSVTRLKGEITYEDITALFVNTQNGFEAYHERSYPDGLSVSFDDDPEKALVDTIEIYDKKCIAVNLSYKSGDITILVEVDTSLESDSYLIQKFVDVSEYIEDGNTTRQVAIPISTKDILGGGFEYETKDGTTYKILNHKIPSTAKSWKIILERFIRRDVAVNINDMLGF